MFRLFKKKENLHHHERVLAEHATSTKQTKIRWYFDENTIIMLLVVGATAFSLPMYRRLNDALPHVHPAAVSLISGIIAGLLALPFMMYADPKYGISSAVLLGLLVAEFVVYGAPLKGDIIAPVAVSFFFFMFLYGLQEATHLWPVNYEDYLSKKSK